MQRKNAESKQQVMWLQSGSLFCDAMQEVCPATHPNASQLSSPLDGWWQIQN